MAEAAKKTYNFQWEGMDRKGKRIKGQHTSANPQEVKAYLRRQGIAPIRVRRESTLFGGGAKKITPGDIAFLSRQLATMMAAGVPLVQSFEIIGSGHKNPKFRELVGGIRGRIEAGSSLTQSLAAEPLYFDDLYINLVGAGEKAGALETLLDKIATYKEKTEAIKKKIKKALFYPAAIVGVAIIVTAILLVYVIPQFASLFQGFGADLPAFTQLVIDISNFVRGPGGGVILLFMVGGGIAFFALKKRSRKFRHYLDRIILRMPIFGMIIEKSIYARFARTLSTMMAAGVPITEALDSLAGATGNIVYEEALKRVRDEVSTGKQLSESLKETALFPNILVQMIGIGEQSGAIEKMSSKVADFYEEEVDNAVDSMSSLMEPFIMVILGVLVGGLVIAMYLPIFKLGAVV